MSKILSLVVYISVYLIATFFISRKKYKKINSFIGIMILTLFAAFRYNVGTDFSNYEFMYLINKDISFKEWIFSLKFTSDGFLVFLISKIAKILGGRSAFFGIFAFLTIKFTLLGINSNFKEKKSKLMILAFLFTYFSVSLNIMKQILAVSICFYGLKFVYEKKFLKYLGVVFLAMTVHISAFISIVIYFLWDKSTNSAKFDFKKICLMTIISIGIMKYDIFLRALGGRFLSYTGYETRLVNLSFFIDLFWLIIFIVLKKHYEKISKKNVLLIFMFFIEIILMFTGFISPFLKRAAIYFSFPSFILISQIPNFFVKKERKIVSVIIFLYILSMFIISYYIKGDADIIPYEFKIM